MRPFSYQSAADAQQAVNAASQAARPGQPPTASGAQFIAGGTTMLDLMKLDVMRPEILVDLNTLRPGMSDIAVGPQGLRLGALAHMADVADSHDVVTQYPAVAQSLMLAASPQLRNMASLGGNALQRTRCTYFRDTSWAACNKRVPGSGCAAMDGVNRTHAVLGTSEHCIATYPGDWAVAMVALEASVDILGPRGSRTIAFVDLHREPGDTPHIETILAPGELITAFTVPAGAWTRRSLYLKIRDRQSYEFALASAAVALEMDGGTVRTARIGLGGVATKPWRAQDAEAELLGKPLDEAACERAARAAFVDARGHGMNDFKIELGRRTLTRALLAAGRMEA